MEEMVGEMMAPTEARFANKTAPANNEDESTKETDAKKQERSRKKRDAETHHKHNSRKDRREKQQHQTCNREKGGQKAESEEEQKHRQQERANMQKTTMGRKTPTGEDKTCQPGLPTRKTEKREDTEQKHDQKGHATWEDVGLIEYNPKTTRWGTDLNTSDTARKGRGRYTGNETRSAQSTA